MKFEDWFFDQNPFICIPIMFATVFSIIIGGAYLTWITNGKIVWALPLLAAFGWYKLWKKYKGQTSK